MKMVPYRGAPVARSGALPVATSPSTQLVPVRQPIVQSVIGTPVAHTAGSIVALVESLQDEARMLGTMANIMRAQRDAVARDDIDAVDQSVFATHRLLVNLGEARRRRRQINVLLGETEDLSVASISDFFGGNVPPAVDEAAGRLGEAGRALQKEVEINRRVLRHAIDSGDRYVRALAGVGTPLGSPVVNARPDIGGALVDRRA